MSPYIALTGRRRNRTVAGYAGFREGTFLVNPLQLSMADWSFFKGIHDAAQFYRSLRGFGYSAAEMVDPARQDIALAAGLKLLNMTCRNFPGLMNHAEQREQAIADMRNDIQIAAARGIGQLIILSGNRKGLDDAAGQRNCINAIKAVAAEAEKAGVVLTLEVFNRYDHPDYQADNSAFAFNVVRAVSSPAVRVLYDLYHMHRMGEDVATVVVRNLPWIAHLHVAGSPNRDFPGNGQEMDYRQIVRTIHQAGYRGFWGMEFLPARPPLDELADAAKLFQSLAG